MLKARAADHIRQGYPCSHVVFFAFFGILLRKGENMLRQQEKLALLTNQFLKQWGLKAKYVAEKCSIPPKVLSLFMHNKLALSPIQLKRLTTYIEDYTLRNS